MTLFGLATILAGVQAQDVTITVLGVVIALVGLLLFAWRQIKRPDDPADAHAAAGVVKMQVPATLVALFVGVVLVLIGQGALTLNSTNDSAMAEALPNTLEVTTTTAPPPTTTTTTAAPTTTWAVIVTPVNPPATELPRTGGADLLPLGLAMVAGGRWVARRA